MGFNGLNQATANVAGIALGMAAIPEFEGLAGGFKIAQGAARFGLSAGVISPSGPNQERFSNALTMLGVHTEFTDWLASNPDNQTVLESRFKNAVDSTVGGAAAEMIFNTAKYAWSIARGAPDAAAMEAAQGAAKEMVPPNAQPSEMVTRAVKRGDGPQVEPTGDGLGTPDKENPAKQHVKDQVAEAVQEDEANGGVEQDAPAGSQAPPKTTKFFAKASGLPDSAYRQVGEMEKSDLQRFHEQAAAYSGKTAEELNVTEDLAPDLHTGIGQFKLSTFQTPDDVAPFMRALLDDAPSIARPMKDTELSAVVSFTAKELGLDNNSAQAFLQGFATEAKPLPIAAGIARTYWAGIVNKLQQNAMQGAENLTDADLQEHLATLATARQWAAHLVDIKAGLGRGLRAWSLPPTGEYTQLFGKPEAEAAIPKMDALPALPRNLSELQDFYELWKSTGGDRTAMADLLQGTQVIPSSWKYLRNSFPNFYTGSLLAGKAIIKGFLMPGFLGTIRTVEKTLGSSIAALNPLNTPEERRALLATATGAPQAYIAATGQMVSAARYMLVAMRQGGTSVIGGGYSGKDAAQRLGPITEQMIHAAQGEPNWRYSLGNLVNMWPRQVFTLVGGHDEFTKRLAYAGEVQVQAMSDAAKQGLKGDDAQQFVKEALANSIDQTGAATDRDMLNRAARTSLIQSHTSGPMSDFITTMDRWRNQIPELRYILPVFDVPANGLGEAIRRIPILSFAFKETRDDLLGTNGAVAQGEAYGRQITGAAVLGTGYSLARTGQLTGPGPDDYRARQIWLKDHQPFSFKVPGVGWVSYKDWEPLGGLLGFIANVYDRTVYAADDDTWQEHVTAAVAGTAEYLKDKGALQQLSDVLNFGGDPKASGNVLKRLVGSTAAGFVPAFIKYGRQLADNDERAKPDLGSYILDALPSQSKKLDPLRNIMGEPIHVPHDTLLENTLPITMSPTTPDAEDSVDREISDMYQRTGYAPGVTSQATLLHGYEDARALKLEDGRSLYDHFMDARQDQIGEDQDGNPANVRQALKSLFDSDDYKGAVYGSATSTGDVLGEASKLKMVSDVFRQFNKAAKEKVAQDSPTARRYLASAQIKSTSPDIFGGRTLNDIAHGEPLLKALGIDIKDYEDAQTGQ